MHGRPGQPRKAGSAGEDSTAQRPLATAGLRLRRRVAERTVTRAWTTKHGETASIGMRSADRDLRNVYERTSAASCSPGADVAGFSFSAWQGRGGA